MTARRSADTGCAGCHARAAAQHALSRHATASTNPTFTTSFAERRLAWCLDCHAPDAADRDGGVTCAACHVDAGGVVVTRPPAARPVEAGDTRPLAAGDAVTAVGAMDGAAPHPVRYDPAFGDGAFCARCHDVRDPSTGAQLQDVAGEWRASLLASTPCTACHFADHRFPGAHDDELMRGAFVLAEVARTRTSITLRVSAVGVGHAAPTGDPFRRLRVRVLDGDDRLLSAATLAHPLRGGRFGAVDDRIPAPTRADPRPSRTVTLDLDAAARPAVATLAIALADPRHAHKLPASEVERAILRVPLVDAAGP